MKKEKSTIKKQKRKASHYVFVVYSTFLSNAFCNVGKFSVMPFHMCQFNIQIQRLKTCTVLSPIFSGLCIDFVLKSYSPRA